MMMMISGREASAAGSSHAISAISQPANTAFVNVTVNEPSITGLLISWNAACTSTGKNGGMRHYGGDHPGAGDIGCEYQAPQPQHAPERRNITVMQQRQNRRQGVFRKQLL